MDHKTFLSTLDPAERVALTTRSDAKGLRHLAGHWGAILLCAAWVAQAAPLWPLMMVVLGIQLVFLFTLLHETSHKTPFASDWLNTGVGHVCGFILFLPATWFRYFHFAHHRFTQIPGKDPELDEAKPETLWQYVRHVSGIPIWAAHVTTLISNAKGAPPYPYVPDARCAKITQEAQLYLAGYAALIALSLWQASTLLIFVWLLPMLLGQPFLRLYLLAEHGRCAMVANMFENSRTTFTNRLVRAIAWNMPYHAEHHSYPSVPFHQLPALHQRVQPHLQATAQGYGAFNRDYIRQMQD